MVRGLLMILTLAALASVSGCETAAELAAGGLFHEALPYDVRFTETSAGPADWTSYQSIRIGPITSGFMHGTVPLTLLADLQPYAQMEIDKEGVLQGQGKTILVTGEVVDFYEGDSRGLRIIGFGDNPVLAIHAKFSDRASGKVLSEAVLASQSKSLREWEEMVSRGLGHSVVKFLASKGIVKPKN